MVVFFFFFPPSPLFPFLLNYDLMSEFSLGERFCSAVNLGCSGDSDTLIYHVTSRDHFLKLISHAVSVAGFPEISLKVVSFYDSINLWCMNPSELQTYYVSQFILV